MTESCVVASAGRGRPSDQKTDPAGSNPAGSENRHPNQKGGITGKKYSTKSDRSEILVTAAPDATDDPALARIIEEAPSRPLPASLEEMLKRYAVHLVARLLHHQAEEYRRQECADHKAGDGKAVAVRNG